MRKEDDAWIRKCVIIQRKEITTTSWCSSRRAESKLLFLNLQYLVVMKDEGLLNLSIFWIYFLNELIISSEHFWNVICHLTFLRSSTSLRANLFFFNLPTNVKIKHVTEEKRVILNIKNNCCNFKKPIYFRGAWSIEIEIRKSPFQRNHKWN